MMSSRPLVLLVLIALSASLNACVGTAGSPEAESPPPPYELVVYNVENLFDADGEAVFDDYKPFDAEGNVRYTPAQVHTKIEKTADIMQRYQNGQGPHIIMFAEIESDFTPLPEATRRDPQAFLQRYADTTLEAMLGDDFNEEIADLPSELLLLKGMDDAGMKGYDVTVAYDRDEQLRPRHVHKNVIFSRLPVLHEKTRSHPVENARPILETWIDVNGHELVLFNNHWKSGASNADIEPTRVQNASVLRARLDALQEANPQVDVVLGGDFNSDYNQSYRYEYMQETAVNDVLRSVGDEQLVAGGGAREVYNLWYEHPIDRRGSDVYRGYWGTLMQLMIGSGLYDYDGIQYVDNSFEVGRFPGENVYEISGAPRRWFAFENGGGYSDHLPISMKFTLATGDGAGESIPLDNPGVNDDAQWEPIPVVYAMPQPDQVIMPQAYAGGESIRQGEYFDELFYVDSEIDRNYRVQVNGESYSLYSPTFNTRERFADVAGSGVPVRFIGRLGTYRGSWQFVIGDEKHVNPDGFAAD